MSSLPKRRRVKKATIVVKRSQLAKNDLFKKRSYKSLYEKLKANNNALAKALSKEKQECQQLFAQKIGLTSELQELKVACNGRDDVLSTVLKKAKDSLELVITVSNHMLETIGLCQQFATTKRYTTRRLSTNDRRESTTRRSSGKSPARGVVQPMVSGHTITKPTINLSRLNIQRKYRVANPPNLSDVEENLTPEASPVAPARTSPVRMPITRSPNYQRATRVNRLPERLQNSMRVSDESERRSSNRNSGRRLARRSRENSERLLLPPASSRGSQAAADAQSGECLHSPSVALHDVSRLLHNSQSVNIRTLMENSSDIDVTQTQQNNGKSQNPSFIDTEDPLEGPSWLLGSSQSVSCAGTTSESQAASPVNSRSRGHRLTERIHNDDNDDEGDGKDDEEESEFFKRLVNNTYDEDDDSSSNLARFVTRKRGSDGVDRDFSLMIPPEKRKPLCDIDLYDLQLPVLESPIAPPVQPTFQEPEHTTNIQRITMTQHRGCLSPDSPTANGLETDFDRTGLMLPMIGENPDSARPSTMLELNSDEDDARSDKRNHKRLYTRIISPPDLSSDSEVTPPPKPHSAGPITAVVEQESDEEDERSDKRKRKTGYKKKVNPPDSTSDPEWTPKQRNIKPKRKPSRAKDPSSAKVVLRKLNDTDVKKKSPSPDPRISLELDNRRSKMAQELSSDSDDSSTASLASKNLSSRPRRQKAPTNLQEPSLGKKLRRH